MATNLSNQPISSSFQALIQYDSNTGTIASWEGDSIIGLDIQVSSSFESVLAETASIATSASYATNADTATSASYALSASFSVDSTQAVSASYSSTAVSASHAINADSSISSSYADTADATPNAVVSVVGGLGSNEISITKGDSSSNSITINNVVNATSSSYSVNSDTAISSSYASTATSASHALNSDVAVSSSYANNATSASYSVNSSQAENATLATTATTSLGGDADNTIITGKNKDLATIPKGTPVYFDASGTSGNLVGIYFADASNPARRPAGGVAGEAILPNDEGRVLLNGFIGGVDTSDFSSGDKVYLKVGGGYTNEAPTGSSNIIQFLGNVEKSAENGSGVIQMMGEERALPNLQENYMWVGGTGDVPTTILSSSFAKLDADNTFTGNNSFSSGSFDDLVVNTLAVTNFNAVTSSVVITGDAFIQLNNDTPTQRYAGIKVVDSGSLNTTASFEFDGSTNDWFYEYSDDGGLTTDHGVVLFGPEYSTKGTPTYPTNNIIQKGNGDHHLVDSIITDNGSLVSVAGNLTANVITANTNFAGDLTGNVNGNASTATSASYAPSVYDTNGTLSSNRTITLGGNTLTFSDTTTNNLVKVNGPGDGTTGIILSSAGSTKANIKLTSDSLFMTNVYSLELTDGFSLSEVYNVGYTGGSFVHDFTGTIVGDVTGDLTGNADTATSASYAPNLFDSNGVLTSARTIDTNGNDLTIGNTDGLTDTTFNIKQNNGSSYINFVNNFDTDVWGIRHDNLASDLTIGKYNLGSLTPSLTIGSFDNKVTAASGFVGNLQGTATSASYAPLDTSGDNTWTGDNTFNGETTFGAGTTAKVTSVGISMNTATIDCSLGDVFTIDITGFDTLATVNFTNMEAGKTIIVRYNNGAGTQSPTYTNVDWEGGTTPTITAADGPNPSVDIHTYVGFGSTTIYGTSVKNML